MNTFKLYPLNVLYLSSIITMALIMVLRVTCMSVPYVNRLTTSIYIASNTFFRSSIMDRLTFMIIMIMMLFIMMPKGPDEATGDKDREVLLLFRQDLTENRRQLAQSEYHLGYGDLAGFKLSYQDNLEHKNVLLWPFRHYSTENPWTETQADSLLPNEISERLKSFWGTLPVEPSGKAYHLNISGKVFGEFELLKPKQKLEPYPLELPSYLRDYYNYHQREKYENEKQQYEQDPENNSPPQEVLDTFDKVGNITTYDRGLIQLSINSLGDAYPDLNIDKHKLGLEEDAVIVVMELTLKNYTESDFNSFRMFGLYFQKTGSLVGISNSAKFRGNHALPHFVMSDANFNKSKTLMGRLTNVTDIQKDISLDDINKSIEKAEQHCEFISYFQFEKTQFTLDQLRYIDLELKLPQGLPLPKTIPQLEISNALLYSPDCGVVIGNKHSAAFVGERVEVTTRKIRRVLICFFLLVLFELNLIMKQTKQCHTPSQLSNVSTLCIGLLSFYDLIVMVLSVITLWRKELYLICTCIGVISGFLYYLFEVRYLLTISATQANERGTTWWEILRGSRSDSEGTAIGARSNTETTPDLTPGAPTPAAAVEPVQANAPAPNLQDGEESNFFIGYAFTGFMLSCVVAYLILIAGEWRITVRRVVEYVGVVLMNSYWVPQFFRNTLKNRGRTLLWEFVFGTSLVRFIPVLYLCLNPSNPFRHGKDPILVYILTCWLLIQIFMLYLQTRLGPRFWVNDRWLPEQYNYHPVMCIRDLEHGFASDILANMKPHSAGSNVSICEIDCAICMSSLSFPILATNDTKEKKSYESMMKECLVTPCHHIFHASCLESWMIYKLQCPVCRCALPPV